MPIHLTKDLEIYKIDAIFKEYPNLFYTEIISTIDVEKSKEQINQSSYPVFEPVIGFIYTYYTFLEEKIAEIYVDQYDNFKKWNFYLIFLNKNFSDEKPLSLSKDILFSLDQKVLSPKFEEIDQFIEKDLNPFIKELSKRAKMFKKVNIIKAIEEL